MKRKLFANITIFLFLFLCTASLYAQELIVPVVKSPYEITNVQWDRRGGTFSYEIEGTLFKRDSNSLILKDQTPSDKTQSEVPTPSLPEGIKPYMGVTSICETKDKNIIIADGPRTASLYNKQGQKLKTYTCTNLISGFSLSPDEETLIIYDLKNTLSFYNAKTGSYIGYSPKFGSRKIKNVLLNADSSRVLVLSSDNSIYVAKTVDILYSPETSAPSIKPFSIAYNVINPNQKSNDGIVEFNVREVQNDNSKNGTEYITTTVEKETSAPEPKFEFYEKPKREEVTITIQPEQEYFPPTVIEIEEKNDSPINPQPEVLESIVTEYKIPEEKKVQVIPELTIDPQKEKESPLPPPPPEVRMITNKVTVQDSQPETVQETVPAVIETPKTIEEEKTEPQPQQTIDLSKLIGDNSSITYTDGQVPQIIIIQQAPETKKEYVYILPEEEEEPPVKKKSIREKKIKPVEEPKQEIITQEIIVEVDEIEEEEEEPEILPEEPEPELKLEEVEEIKEPEEIPEPEVTIVQKKERKKLSEEDKKKLFKDGHGVELNFDVSKLNDPYNLELGISLAYKNYNIIRPFYFGGMIKPFLAFPSEQFPYTYKTITETLKNPYMIGTKVMAPVGFCYYPLKNSFELYAEAYIGITLNSIWNGSMPPNSIISKAYPAICTGAKIGACWDFFDLSFNIDYDPITKFTFGASLGVIINIGGSRIIGGTRFK